jgi:hypothetical protein
MTVLTFSVFWKDLRILGRGRGKAYMFDTGHKNMFVPFYAYGYSVEETYSIRVKTFKKYNPVPTLEWKYGNV